jgi:hypothetical protein
VRRIQADGTYQTETNERKGTNWTYTTLHQGHCQKCCGAFGQMLRGIDGCAKAIYPGCHCSYSVVKLSACVIFHWYRALVYHARASLARKWPVSLLPLRRLTLSIRYIFVKLTTPWMFFGISLFKQVFCEGGIDIRNNTTKSHLAVRPLTTYPVCSTPNQRSCHVRPWRNGLGV